MSDGYLGIKDEGVMGDIKPSYIGGGSSNVSDDWPKIKGV